MRPHNWQLRLAEFGRARASMPFSWGTNDCCTFAAAAVEAVSGSNPMSSMEPYGTEAGRKRKALRRLLRRIDKAGGLKALVTEFLGAPISPRMASVGDVVLVLNAGAEVVGVCNGINIMAPGASGVVTLSMDAAVAAWRI